jgi:hypothetical protein
VASLFINSLQDGHSCLLPLVNKAMTTAIGPKNNPKIKPQKASPFLEPIMAVIKAQQNQKIKILT